MTQLNIHVYLFFVILLMIIVPKDIEYNLLAIQEDPVSLFYIFKKNVYLPLLGLICGPWDLLLRLSLVVVCGL